MCYVYVFSTYHKQTCWGSWQELMYCLSFVLSKFRGFWNDNRYIDHEHQVTPDNLPSTTIRHCLLLCFSSSMHSAILFTITMMYFRLLKANRCSLVLPQTPHNSYLSSISSCFSRYWKTVDIRSFSNPFRCVCNFIRHDYQCRVRGFMRSHLICKQKYLERQHEVQEAAVICKASEMTPIILSLYFFWKSSAWREKKKKFGSITVKINNPWHSLS